MTDTNFTDSTDKATGVTDAGMGGFLPLGGDSSATGLYRFLPAFNCRFLGRIIVGRHDPRMRFINTTLLTMLLAVIGAQCLAQEGSFDGITCQTNILKTLVGRHMPNAKVADIESRYRGIHLKYLGGFGLPEDPYFLGTWLICGTEYLVLEKQSIVRDVLQSPLPFERAQSVLADCTAEKGPHWTTAVIFLPESRGQPPWSVEELWVIDEGNLKFRRVHDGRVSCGP